jgi:hypothetical protein
MQDIFLNRNDTTIDYVLVGEDTDQGWEFWQSENSLPGQYSKPYLIYFHLLPRGSSSTLVEIKFNFHDLITLFFQVLLEKLQGFLVKYNKFYFHFF